MEILQSIGVACVVFSFVFIFVLKYELTMAKNRITDLEVKSANLVKQVKDLQDKLNDHTKNS